MLDDDVRTALEAIVFNDATPDYQYGEARKFDEACPPVGSRWQTPREIALGLLRERTGVRL